MWNFSASFSAGLEYPIQSRFAICAMLDGTGRNDPDTSSLVTV